LVDPEIEVRPIATQVDDLLSEIKRRDPALAGKVYLMEDCSSPVVIPDQVDFTEQADQAYYRFAEAGMNLVKSTEPISSWPEMKL
jgi:nicotinamidase-related amidase